MVAKVRNKLYSTPLAPLLCMDGLKKHLEADGYKSLLSDSHLYLKFNGMLFMYVAVTVDESAMLKNRCDVDSSCPELALVTSALARHLNCISNRH